MNEAVKLTLSTEELQLVTNTRWILTKHVIIDKAMHLLGNHTAFAQACIAQMQLPETVKQSNPKIARGENYLQLPWLMLDYPRLFNKDNILAVRTFFWWGNFFSCTLHLGGSYKTQFEKKVIKNIATLQHFFICVNEDEWQHHFEENNYKPLNSLSKIDIENIITGKNFIKISCKFQLQQWDNMPLLLQQSFTTLLNLLIN